MSPRLPRDGMAVPPTQKWRSVTVNPQDPFSTNVLERAVPLAPNSLTGRRAVVTASGGMMGGSIALRLADAGADVVLNDIVPGSTAPYAQPGATCPKYSARDERHGDRSPRAKPEFPKC